MVQGNKTSLDEDESCRRFRSSLLLLLGTTPLLLLNGTSYKCCRCGGGPACYFNTTSFLEDNCIGPKADAMMTRTHWLLV